jgi:MOSC domain-containing protein YiiM
MIEIAEAHTVPGRGIEGDRYYSDIGHFSRQHGPSYEVTLIEQEAINALNEEFPDLHLQPEMSRRNIVTCGVPLNHLVEHVFQVGEVSLRGIRLCQPCIQIAQGTHHNVLARLVNRGGLRAQILTEGYIRVGDLIQDVRAEGVQHGQEDVDEVADRTKKKGSYATSLLPKVVY